MFNSTQGRAAFISKIERLSDQIGADLDDLLKDGSVDRRTKEIFFEQFATLAASRALMLEFAQDTFAQSNSGQPAKALGSSSSTTPTTPRQRLADDLSDLGISPGQIQGVLRIVNAPDDPGHIHVQDDGTPTELAALRKEVQTAKAALKDAQDELAKEKAKKATPATDVVAKATLQPHVTAAQTELGRARKNPVGGGYGIKSDDHKALQDAIAALASLAS